MIVAVQGQYNHVTCEVRNFNYLGQALTWMMLHKDRHYWAQLRGVLAAGQWSSQYPAKALNGAPLSWSELFRKFNKHCSGHNDVSEVASQTQALARLLSAKSHSDDQDDLPKSGEYKLDLDSECRLPDELIDEATRRYNSLKSMKVSNLDVSTIGLHYIHLLGHFHT
jgi:hypothetical protein